MGLDTRDVFLKRSAKSCRPTIFIFFVLSQFIGADTSLGSPNKAFAGELAWKNSHQPIDPKLYHGVHNTPLDSTLQKNGEHVHHVTMKYKSVHQEEIALDLQLNRVLLPQDHFLHYQLPHNKGYALKNFTLQDIDHCHYTGRIRGNPESSVAISTCDNAINGVIFDGSDTFYIHPTTSGELEAQIRNHYLLRHSALDLANKTCSYEGTYESNPHRHKEEVERPLYSRYNRLKRATADETTTIRGPYNSNAESSYVELILVVDNKLYKAMDSSLRRVHNHCKMISNIINAVYTPLNIFIALIGVVVWNESNEVELSSDGDRTLKNFLLYRRKTLVKRFPNDNAQLLTREQFDGGVVGKALKGPICTYEFSGGVSMDHSQIVAVVATTVAHELGHNFGMEHDTADCKCEDDRCIMSASSSSVAPKHWSSCSIDQLNLAFHQGMNYCLRNKPKSLFDSPQCGNGFVEPGEQCDCGLPQFCKNTCCDPYTCMLLKNATCATGACCDLSSCRPHRAGTLCRDANGECDLPEFCMGESEYCPSDVFKRDTEVCGKGRAYCYEGSCRSRTDQCRVLWGISGNSSDECYTKNENASRHGNCGYDRVANEYVKCHSDDIYCGMLHCRHTNEKLEFGMENVAVLSHSFLNHENRIVACRTAIVDLGLESTDPGLTPNGAKCGEGKMCVNQHCLAIEEVVKGGKGRQCPDNCNNHGVCNSEGACHCDVGFAPPACVYPGPGGSVNSGPATDPNVGEGFAMFLIIFCGMILPLVALVFCIFWCRKHQPDKAFIFRRPFNMSKPLMKFGSSSKGSTNTSANTNVSNSPGMSSSTPDDMNASLLRPTNEEAVLNNTMFGKFKGFTMRPLQESSAPTAASNLGPNVALVQPVSKHSSSPTSTVTIETATAFKSPVRIAPSTPQIPTGSGRRVNYSPKDKANGRKIVSMGTDDVVNTHQNECNEPPALPPLNPGSNPRPLISNPIFESTTSTAKEMLSTFNDGKPLTPVRPAPKLENTSSDVVNFGTKPLPPIVNKGGTLQRIRSLIKKDDKPVPPLSVISPVPSEVVPAKSFQRNTPKFIDRNRLKTIEISAPIPQMETQTEINNRKSVLARTHSMRKDVAAEPQLLSFGSTRSMRPKSIANSRPKSPPPPRPPAPAIANVAFDNKAKAVAQMDAYERPPAPKRVEFAQDLKSDVAPLAVDECMSPSNIYAVIDEHRKIAYDDLKSGENTSMESLGLLGEIVNEIENRNEQSIYSSGLHPKPPIDEEGPYYANAKEVATEEAKGHTRSPENVDESQGNLKTNTNGPSRAYSKSQNVMPVARVAPTKANSVDIDKPKAAVKNSFDSKGTRPVGNLSKTYSTPVAKNVVQPKTIVPTHVVGRPDPKKPKVPNKPVIARVPSTVSAKLSLENSSDATDTEPSNSKGVAKPLSNVERMQRKFETAHKK